MLPGTVNSQRNGVPNAAATQNYLRQSNTRSSAVAVMANHTAYGTYSTV